MALDPTLLPQVRAALITARTLGYNSRSAAHDVYEAYLLAILVRAARAQGWAYDVRNFNGSLARRAIFRKGPGRLCNGGFSHVLLTRGGKQDLEAHIGVRVTGESTVAHEFDLLVLTSANAQVCRNGCRDPAYGEVIAHAEAKYYSADIPLHLSRAVLGLSTDCQLVGKSVLVTNKNNRSGEILLCHHGLDFRYLVHPSHPRGEGHLLNLFERVLQNAP